MDSMISMGEEGGAHNSPNAGSGIEQQQQQQPGDEAAAPSSSYQEMAEMEEAEQIVEEAAGKAAHEPKRASARSTAFVMACNVIGGGITALPSGFVDSSLLVGILLLFFNASLTMLTLNFIVQCSDALDEYSYDKVLERGLGRGWAIFTLISLTCFPAGACISYSRIIADAIPPVLENFFGADPNSFITSPVCWILIGSSCFFVLSCRRTLSEMFVISIFGLVTIFFGVFCVIIRFFDGTYEVPGSNSLVDPSFSFAYLDVKMFKTIPLILFALSVHNNAGAYYQELENRSPAKMMSVIYKAHVVIVASYLVTGLFGVLTWGRNRIARAKGNILDAYDENDVLLNVCRLLMFIHFASVYPILLLATRRGLNLLFFAWKERAAAAATVPISRWLPMRVIVIETFFIVVVCAVIAGVVPDIEDILSVNGAVFGSVVILIMPSFLWLKVIGSQREGWWVAEGAKMKLVALFTIIYGVIVGVVGLVVTVTSKHAKETPAANTTAANATANATTVAPAAAVSMLRALTPVG